MTTEPTLLKIGEFAQLGHVTIATLHHYDEYGLLKPAALDPQTNYRYYALAQLPLLNRILALKELGFALEQIALLLQADLSAEQLHEMFKQRQADTQHVVATEQRRLRDLAFRLRQIEGEAILFTPDVLVKQVDPLLVASMRARVPHLSEWGRLAAPLVAYLEEQGQSDLPPALLVLHSRHEMHADRMSIDLEVAVPLTSPLPGNEPIQVRALPGGLVAYAFHPASDISLGRVYAMLHDWIETNGYRLNGPVRQISLQRFPAAMTEVQMPIEPLPIDASLKDGAPKGNAHAATA